MAPRVDHRLYYVLPLTVVRRPTFIHQLTRGLGFPRRTNYSVELASVQAPVANSVMRIGHSDPILRGRYCRAAILMKPSLTEKRDGPTTPTQNQFR